MALDAEGEQGRRAPRSPSPRAPRTWRLLESGYQPLEVAEKKSVLKFEITKKMVPRKDVGHFSRQLAVFMKAGIPIMEALEVILDETTQKIIKKVLAKMIEDLRAGDTFASAAAAHPEAFPAYYVGILESAEMTGNLDTVLNQLADYIDRDTEARRKITSAMIYPGDRARACRSWTVVVLAVFVLPKFVVVLQLAERQASAADADAAGDVGVRLELVVGHRAVHPRRRSSGSSRCAGRETGRAKLDAVMLKMPGAR